MASDATRKSGAIVPVHRRGGPLASTAESRPGARREPAQFTTTMQPVPRFASAPQSWSALARSASGPACTR